MSKEIIEENTDEDQKDQQSDMVGQEVVDGDHLQKKLKKIRPLYWTKKEPRKALSTYFRNQNKALVTSISIADRKAMIMIRVNSMMVSAGVLFFRYINENIQLGWLIAAILIIGTGGALVYSVLAARPDGKWMHKFFMNQIYPTYPELKCNNFMPLTFPTLEEYERSMDQVVQSQELQIGNQVRFSYLMENYLTKKYKYLDIAYSLFMVSFVGIAVIFVIGRFLALNAI